MVELNLDNVFPVITFNKSVTYQKVYWDLHFHSCKELPIRIFPPPLETGYLSTFCRLSQIAWGNERLVI